MISKKMIFVPFLQLEKSSGGELIGFLHVEGGHYNEPRKFAGSKAFSCFFYIFLPLKMSFCWCLLRFLLFALIFAGFV